MKRILGLDLGTNSIGWAVVERNEYEGRIVKSGSRIIPMDADILSNFSKGNTKSQTADRTAKRIARRMRERFLLRRERLHRILHHIGYLPKHYDEKIAWDIENDNKHYGNFYEGEEPKIAWKKDATGKYRFLFQDSFDEMLKDFKASHPELTSNGEKIPYDWTLYYLRKKALRENISKYELAWIILNFNQKRGYNQLRDENFENTDNKKREYKSLTVSNVTTDDSSKGKDTWYNITFKEDSSIIYRRKSKYPLDNWVGKKRELIITTTLDENGAPKLKTNGTIDCSISSPNENDDWALHKIKTEQDLKESKLTVGQFIYDTLLAKPSEKIRGGLVRTIERTFYKEELKLILKKQAEFHPELTNRELYKECIADLYPHNEDHRSKITHKDFSYLLMEDVIFYQRPLKSKKSLIDNCPYEYRKGVDKETGEECTYPIKCIAKSNPYFQEYRIWKFLSDLRIIQKDVKEIDVTHEYLSDNISDNNPNIKTWSDIFDWLNKKKAITQSELLNYVGIAKKEQDNYRWNFPEDKIYPMNATRHALLAKMMAADHEKLTRDIEYKLWHLLYSIKSKAEIDQSLSESRNGHIYSILISAGFSKDSIEKLKSAKLPDEGYGAYSEKAIKKLLPLMRTETYWDANAIDSNTKNRIEKFLKGELLEEFKQNARDKIASLTSLNLYQRLPEWLACYVVYGKHSEAIDVVKWHAPKDIDVYLNNFKQHSLRNPIVESVILETLRVVRDIWKRFGDIDEIHVEMGRDLKNPADKRRRISEQNQDNENANFRIKNLLQQLIDSEFKILDVDPYSPSHQEKLRIYEDAVLSKYEQDAEPEILKIKNNLSDPTKNPTKNEVLRYKLWLEQKYRSPYTGEMIPLSHLFTHDYEVDHIIPRSRYFDDSFSNKVICEAEVNNKKDNRLGYEFIKECHGKIVNLSLGKNVKIYEVADYERYINETYKDSRSATKRKNLLLDDIPEKFTNRQMNDNRYISKVIKGLLSNIVRTVEQEGKLENDATPKNLIITNGSITSKLRNEWGLNEVWNDLVLPRFKRLNKITDSTCFTTYNKGNKEIPKIPLEQQKELSIKRIDHRHHAMDAIVIACTTREHVNLLNNLYAHPKDEKTRHDLSKKLRRREEVLRDGKKILVYKEFKMPWPAFKGDAAQSLKSLVVSFKQNIRILNKTKNLYMKFEDGKKLLSPQDSDNYVIRQPLHKETFYGHVNLKLKEKVNLKKALNNVDLIVDKRLKKKIKELKAKQFNDKQLLKYFDEFRHEWKEYDFNEKNIELYYYTDNEKREKQVATRFGNDLVSIFKSISKKEKIEKKIETITDSGIRKILTNYLKENLDNIEFAFSADGLEQFNENISNYNDGKYHKPIYKVRMYEKMGLKFQLGHTGNKSSKYVEAAKGTNLYFAIYSNKEGTRSYSTIPLNTIIKQLKQNLPPVPEHNEKSANLLFYLSPGDLVYLPRSNDEVNTETIETNRIYKFVSCAGGQAFFVPHQIAYPIVETEELGSNNKAERSWTGEMIKETCIPLPVSRLGDIEL